MIFVSGIYSRKALRTDNRYFIRYAQNYLVKFNDNYFKLFTRCRFFEASTTFFKKDIAFNI